MGGGGVRKPQKGAAATYLSQTTPTNIAATTAMVAPSTASARSHLVQRLVHPAVMATDGGVEDIVGVLKGIHEGHRVRADGLQQVACSAVDHRNLGGAQCHKNGMSTQKMEPTTSAETAASTN